MTTFVGRFRTDDGHERTFRLEADAFEHAVDLLEAMRTTAVIDGELVDEGESDRPFMPIGMA